LINNYRELQRQFHPDKFANSSDMEKRLSVQHSAQINDAYQTLKIPLKRAIYQLSLLGLELKDNETAMDPMFLMEQMELREKLEQLTANPNADIALEKMQTEISKKINSHLKEISILFNFVEENVERNGEENYLENIKKNILKMQFLSKLEQQCDDLEEDLSNLL
jgi:molecular chaperone HscB